MANSIDSISMNELQQCVSLSSKSRWEDSNFREAALACYSMLRGFLNTMDAESPDCSKRFMCEVGC